MASHLRAAGWRVCTTSSKANRILRLTDMLWTVFRARREYAVAHIDVFSGRAFFWADMTSILLRWIRKPYVLTLHGGRLPEFAARRPNRVRAILRSAAVVTAPSRYLSDSMSQYCKRVIVLPNALDLKHYPYRNRANPSANLVWIRAFHEIYNPLMAVKVVAELRAQFPELRLTMIGPDKGDGTRREVLRATRELGLEGCVDVRGPVPKTEIPRWLDLADIFINTSDIDNTPVTVLEAMACGLSVVSTNVGGIPCMLEDQVDSLLVERDAPSQMANAVRRLLLEPGLSSRLSTNARQRAMAFDWKLVLEKWATVFVEASQLKNRQSHYKSQMS